MKTKQSHGEMLEPKMREVHHNLSKLGFSDEHFVIIFHKYITTPAELRFLLDEIEEIRQFADIIQNKINNFLANAKVIIAEGEKQAAGNASLHATN